MIRVLMVCTGNICRSPLAEGLLRAAAEQAGLQDRIEVDSAGTTDYHAGEPPDRRAQTAARQRGLSLQHLRARRVVPADLERFDYLLAMDDSHVAYLQQLCQDPGPLGKIYRMLDFAPQLPAREVPDPYMGGQRNFELVMQLLELATQGLLDYLRDHHPELRTDA